MSSRHIFMGLIALITCILILCFWQPAQAQSPLPDTVVYSWGYGDISQPERVCQQITTHFRPQRPGLERQPVRVHSAIVEPQFCQ